MALADTHHDPHEAHGAHEEHAEHVEHNSPWPGPVALFAGVMMAGLATSFSYPGIGMFLLGGGTVAWTYAMTRWWKDVSASSAYERGMLNPAESMEYSNFRKGMLFFIASEVLFFFAFFDHLFGVRVQTMVWPPHVGNYHIDLPFGAFNTTILFLSGISMRIAHNMILRGNRKGLVTWSVITALMGSYFLAAQVWEYTVLPFALKDGIFGTSFYVLTGFHGFHVFIGVVFIWVIGFRAMAGHFTPQRHFAVLAGYWYWLFVDLIWLLIIFPLFYILPRFHM